MKLSVCISEIEIESEIEWMSEWVSKAISCSSIDGISQCYVLDRNDPLHLNNLLVFFFSSASVFWSG